MSDLPELLGCPHCGGPAEMRGDNAPENWVHCAANCQPSGRNKQRLITAWNTRAPGKTCNESGEADVKQAIQIVKERFIVREGSERQLSEKYFIMAEYAIERVFQAALSSCRNTALPEQCAAAVTVPDDYEEKYHRVMCLLVSTKMDHGLCQPRGRLACTACNARDVLDLMAAEYCGPPIVRSAAPTPASLDDGGN